MSFSKISRLFPPGVLLLLPLLFINFGKGDDIPHRVGCFEKGNLDAALNSFRSKLIWFQNNITDTTVCSQECKDFHLIGVQRQVCLCIQLADKETKPLKPVRISDTCCDDRKNTAANFGGFGNFTIFCLGSGCRSGFESGINASIQCDVPAKNENASTLDNFIPQKEENENDILSFKEGSEVGYEICPNFESSNLKGLQFFRDYIPGLKENPYLCKQHCEAKNPNGYKISMVAILSSSQFGEVVFCQCAKVSSDFQTRSIKTCKRCPKDLEESESVCTNLKSDVKYKLFCDYGSTDCEDKSHWSARDIFLKVIVPIIVGISSCVGIYCCWIKNRTSGVCSQDAGGKDIPLQNQRQSRKTENPNQSDNVSNRLGQETEALMTQNQTTEIVPFVHPSYKPLEPKQ